MSETTTGASTTPGTQHGKTRDPREPARTRIELTLFFGMVLALAGVVEGLVVALHRHEIDCPDGTYFPQDATDFRCFSHPAAGQGIAIALFSVMFAVVLGLAVFIAASVVAQRVDKAATEFPDRPLT